MELSNILKVQIKNLWKLIVCFVAFWIVIGLVLLIPTSLNKTIYELVFSSYLVLSAIFIILIAIEIYGKYGKTFIFIQNNRFIYVMTGIIWNFISSLLVTLLMLGVKACTLHATKGIDGINSIDFKYILMLFSAYVLFFNIGTIYSLFFQYHKKRKNVLIMLFILIFLLFGYFTLPFVINIMKVFINFTSSKMELWYFIPLIIVNLLSIVLTTIYYCKQNILKAYSQE